MLATTAYTRETSPTVGYSCPDGERFTVEFHTDHVRLRTGAGVFALAVDPPAAGEKYSDGYTVFSATGSQAQLERPGLAPHKNCSPLKQPI